MQTSVHIIRRQFLEIEAPDLAIAERIQTDFEHWMSASFAAKIDSLLEEEGFADKWIQIDRLYFSLKLTPGMDWLKEFDRLLTMELRKSTAAIIQEKSSSPVAEPQLKNQKKQIWEIWMHFLNLGFFPWWAERTNWPKFEQQVIQTITLQPEKLKILTVYLKDSERRLDRLISQFSSSFLQQLFDQLSAEAETHTNELAQKLSIFLQTIGLFTKESPLFWKLLFTAQLYSDLETFPSFFVQLFRYLLRHPESLQASSKWWSKAGITERQLLSTWLFQPFSRFLQHSGIQSDQASELLRKHWISQLKKWTKTQTRPISPIANPITRENEEQINNQAIEEGQLRKQPSENPANNISEEQVKPEEKEGKKYINLKKEENQEFISEQGEANTDMLKGQAENVSNTKPTNSSSESIGQQMRRKKGKKEFDQNPQEYLEELKEGIFIENAGLVLLHPFFQHFFASLNLLKENTFTSEEKQQRAVCLLQFLASGQEVFYEHELLLPKILCNWPIEDTLETRILITPEEKKESRELLLSVIDHWGVLKNTDEAGLREGFLRREGKIIRLNGKLTIKVAQETADILLSRLPWGLGMIKLPWLQELLYTEWT